MLHPAQLDRVIHEPSRLAIMTLLAARREWAFQDLKTELGLSDGNLVTHLRSLHARGYVSVTREVRDRPRSTYALTRRGRAAFRAYLAVLERIVDRAKV